MEHPGRNAQSLLSPPPSFPRSLAPTCPSRGACGGRAQGAHQGPCGAPKRCPPNLSCCHLQGTGERGGAKESSSEEARSGSVCKLPGSSPTTQLSPRGGNNALSLRMGGLWLCSGASKGFLKVWDISFVQIPVPSPPTGPGIQTSTTARGMRQCAIVSMTRARRSPLLN